MARKKEKPAPTSQPPAFGAEAYEAVYFARKCGLTPDEALRMIREAQQGPVAIVQQSRKLKT